jgi:NADH:ubiquinone oxidoreductase subunit 6 (subunit J)
VDIVLTVVFFLCAILAVAGALGASLAPAASWRLPGLLALALGTAGVLAAFSASIAAVVALVSLVAAALLLCRAGAVPVRDGDLRMAARPAQVGGVASALLLAVLLAVAVGGTFAASGPAGTGFDPGALGRAFFGRDALALEAVGAMLMAALAVGAAARGRRS